jgi:hypothetical protein
MVVVVARRAASLQRLVALGLRQEAAVAAAGLTVAALVRTAAMVQPAVSALHGHEVI